MATRVGGIVRKMRRPFEEFMHAEASGGIVLFVAAVLAVGWANSPLADSYHHAFETHLAIGYGRWTLDLPLHAWINDALMAVFFFLVGLEIKREFLTGELSSARSAALPIVGALGGMVVPALIFASITRGTDGIAGWGIPMATDIAFALGVVTLLGSRVAPGLKVFLAALAIVDDLGAVLVIALFYTAGIDARALAAASGILLMLGVLNRYNVNRVWPYLILGVLLWLAVFHSGLHATIAGVLLAMFVPASARRTRVRVDSTTDAASSRSTTTVSVEEVPSLLAKFERVLHQPVAFLIMPVFALANAGVSLSGMGSSVLTDQVFLAVVLGLVIGKPIGIGGLSYLAVKLKIAQLPNGVAWRQLVGVAALGGIGFTMSLFIGALAYGENAHLTSAKIGVMTGSLIAGLLGWAIIRSGAAKSSVIAESTTTP